MIEFRFSLEKALHLRRVQLQLSEARFRQEAAALVELERSREALRTSRADAEAHVRMGGTARGCDLAALGAFGRHVGARQKQLAQQYAEGEKKLDECRTAMLEARRRCRLMEKLKERRRADWQTALNRELEELAGESFLAQWSRRQA
jgi:flagellar export protein FliJ